MVTRYFSQFQARGGRSTKQALSVPHVSGGRPVGLHRIEVGTSSGEIAEITRKVSFHVAHSFRSEEAQFWAKTCAREPDSNAIFCRMLGCRESLGHCKMAVQRWGPQWIVLNLADSAELT